MGTIIALFVLAGIIWFWLDSIKTKELAVSAAYQACYGMQVQFLDQTVSLAKLKLLRNAQGRMILQRIYHFDFSISGEPSIAIQRYHGQVIMQSQSVQHIHLDKPEGLIISSQEDNTFSKED